MTNPKKSAKRSSSRKPKTTASAPKPARKAATYAVSEATIRDSMAFREATSKAEAYAKNPQRLRQLFDEALKKSQRIPRGPFAETWAYLLAMLRLIRAYQIGRYREMPWQSLIVVIIAIIYFVSPIDVIPDWVPVLGLIDDAFLVGLMLKSVKDDLDAFMEWETSQEEGIG